MKKGYWVIAYRTIADEATMKLRGAGCGGGGVVWGAAVGGAEERGYGSRSGAEADDGRGGVR